MKEIPALYDSRHVGLPCAESELLVAMNGGAPYDAGHTAAGAASDRAVTDTERKLCIAPGRRVATAAWKLAA